MRLWNYCPPGQPSAPGHVGQADAVLGLSGSLRCCCAQASWLVGVAGGLVDAAAGCSPPHLAGSGLVEVPAGGLLAPVVMSAQRPMLP